MGINQTKDFLLKICINKLYEKGLLNDLYKERLKSELKEIEIQMEFDYFVDLYNKKVKFEENENNLLIPYVLGLVDEFDINQPPKYIQGEFPDIDTDFQKEVQKYIKDTWAPKFFGEDKVLSIGNYSTFGLKSSLIDMARVHDLDRNEILAITTKMGLKDEDGKTLTWEKALEEYKELKDYCERNVEVANAVKKILHRNRGTGKHAGGLIISSKRIDNLVPIIKSKSDDDSDVFVSAFSEGLAGTDLGPLGIIKFDLLVITNLTQIAYCCKLIKERYNLSSICAFSGKPDWSDTSYLNDPKAIALANSGKLKCIFQFDSNGIQELVKKSGINSFDDLVSISALYRPGPMGAGMHEVFCNRKNGKEYYELHPVLEEILGNTYGVMCYQEQVMKILNKVGDIPEMHCEIVRKAISKKKFDVFSKYKEMFVEKGQEILSWTEEQVLELWGQIESFAEYGFNKSHSVAYTYISSRLLWLKAHYPLEFFTAVLFCENNDKKIKEYKREAESMGLKIHPVDINKSKAKFSINNEEIYMGFSGVKGIGPEVAEDIVSKQPYNSFGDFILKFGTNARVVEPLMELNVFHENPYKMYEYYDYYKDLKKKNDARNQRFNKKVDEFIQLINPYLNKYFLYKDENSAFEFLERYYLSKDEDDFLNNVLEDKIFGEDAELLWEIVKKYKKSREGNVKKNLDNIITPYNDYVFQDKVSTEVKEILSQPYSFIENKHYGFSWKHILEFSDDYIGGNTLSDILSDESIVVAMIEAQIIKKPVKKISKKGTEYYMIFLEDANSTTVDVTVWKEDYLRFQEEFSHWNNDKLKGNLVKIRLKKPEEGGFNSWTFYSPPKILRKSLVPENKEDDNRLILMSYPTNLNKSQEFQE